MAVTPDHGDCIVAFLSDVKRIDIFRYFIDLKNLSSIYFINAACTLALDS